MKTACRPTLTASLHGLTAVDPDGKYGLLPLDDLEAAQAWLCIMLATDDVGRSLSLSLSQLHLCEEVLRCLQHCPALLDFGVKKK